MASVNSSNTTTLAGIAKEIYPIDEIKKVEQLVTAFKKEVEETSELQFSAADGGSFKFAVKAHGPHGQKMVNEQEALPNARASSVVQGEAALKEYVGVLQFTKREMELAKNDTASFADAKTLEMEGMIENAGKYFNRQMANGDGTGTITLLAATEAVGQTTLSVDDATPFQIGMVIDQYNAAGTTKQNEGLVVTDIDILSTPNTITVDTALTVEGEDNGIICLAGVKDNASSDGKEMIGLPLVTDDGTLAATFQGITRTGAGETPNYRGIKLDANSAPISHALVNQMLSRGFRIGGMDFTKMDDVYALLSPEQWRAYAALTAPQVHFVISEAPDGNKNFGKYQIAGKRAVLDNDVARDKLFFIRKSAVKLGVACALDWEEDLGGTSLKWLSGTTQGIMVLYALQQFFAESVREVLEIDNLATVSI